VAPHLTCVDASKEETLEIVRDYLNQGITKLVALRGDPRDGVEGVYTPPVNGFAYASDLVAGLRDLQGLELFVSAYPETHPQAPNADFDIEVLKSKQDNGASAAITQFFFNNDDFFRYRDRAATAGVTMPIIPGIMVPENIKGVLRFAKACGATVPSSLSSRFAGIEDDEETRRLIATHFTIQQCEQLVAAGVKHFHLYTLNRAESAYAVCHALGLREQLVEAA
ncbi:MAG: methylenetetrahydrofolate reductase, partial [Luminiphilus sp.]